MRRRSPQRQRARHLRKLSAEIAIAGGGVRAGFRVFADMTTAQIAERLSLPRQSVEQALQAPSLGRQYGHVRRALEAEFELPAYSLEDLVNESR